MYVSLSLSAAAFAKELHTPTTDELIEFQAPSSAAISPDGRFVAYTVRETHWAENSYGVQLWLAEVRTGRIVKLTNSMGANREPEWSPDGRWLAFISSRDGAPQVYVISPAGGEARPVTSLGNGVSAFRWAPDSARIAFSMPDSETQPLLDRREKYSDFESVWHDYTMTHLWVGDINGGPPKRLTSGKQFTVGSFSWSPDGYRIAFDAQSRPGLTFDPSADIYVCDLAAGSVKKIVDLEGPDTDPEWSPDGKQIVFTTTMGRPNWFYVDRNLATVPADGGAVTSLTPDFDESASAVAWTQAGVYFTAPKKSGVHLFHLDPRTGVIRQISTRENAVYSSISFNGDFKTVAFLETDASRCPEVYVSQLKPVCWKSSDRVSRSTQRLEYCQARNDFLDEHRRVSHRGRPNETCQFRSQQEVPAVNHSPWRPCSLGCTRDPRDELILSKRDMGRKRRAHFGTQLSGKSWLRRKNALSLDAQFGAGSIRGHCLRCGLSGVIGNGRKGSRRYYGLELWRLHLGIYEHQ